MNRIARHALHASIAATAAAGAWHGSECWKMDTYQSTDSMLASAGAALGGFAFAALSILLTVAERPFIRRMSDRGYFKDLLSELLWAAGLLLISVVASIAGSFCPDTAVRPLMAGNVFFFTLGFCRMLRGGYNFSMLLDFLARPQAGATNTR